MLCDFELLAGNNNLVDMANLQSFQIFSKNVIELFSDLSRQILSDANSKNYPDLITFAFHVRKSNINIIRRNYIDIVGSAYGRGLAYHIGPANVPMNFAYSMFYSLLAGNPTILRVPTKDYHQINYFCSKLNTVLKKEKHENFKQYFSLIRYDKSNDLTKSLSAICKIRVIWGSDETVKAILDNPKNIRCKDLVFPTRISWAVISAKLILEQISNLNEIANAFFDDTFSLDQNACSSPSQIFFLRDDPQFEKCRELFWDAVKDVMRTRNYQLNEAIVMNREIASAGAAMLNSECHVNRKYLPFFHLISAPLVSRDVIQFKVGGGLFFEYFIDDLESLGEYLSPYVQTITTQKDFVPVVRKCLYEKCPGQVDRVVNFGRALEFSAIWDGYDLIREMSNLRV